jgi:beta-propeller repeat-containing protein/uncharacterized protein DUF11
VRLSRVGLETTGLRARTILFLAALLMLAVVALRLDVRHIAGGNAAAKTALRKQQVVASFGHLPLIFEPNQGQTNPAVKFLAHGPRYGLFLTQNEAVLTLHRSATGKDSPEVSVVRMGLAGAAANAVVDATNELPGKSNYFIGNDSAKWHRNIPQFARVRYSGIYRGVDLVYYGKQGQLEYDFEVAPDGDPRKIALSFAGATNLALAHNGDLAIELDGGELRLLAPHVYQKFGTDERTVAARFELRGKEVGFALGDYDRSRELVIDPVLTYSTYLGGSGIESCSTITGLAQTPECPGIAVDAGTNAYIAGATTSSDFPIFPKPTGAFQEQLGGPGATNVFVSKFNPTGSALLYSTYLGGTVVDYPAGIAVDSAGQAYVAGTTTSPDFPTAGSNAPFQGTPLNPGHQHVFMSKFDNAGAALLYSTYLSGSGVDIASGIALDTAANVYVTGTTTSSEVETGFPSTIGALQEKPTIPGLNQFFLTKLTPTIPGINSVPYSTYIGGSTPSNATVTGGGVAVDTNGNAYITGGSNFSDIEQQFAYQVYQTSNGVDVYVAKINPTAPSGSQLIYATYLGGPGTDVGYGIAVDGSDNAYITGSTSSTNCLGFTPCPNTGAFQESYGGGVSDAFVAKLGVPCVGSSCSTTDVPFSYFTYLGGSLTDVGTSIAVDTIGGARVTGWTSSTDFPVRNNHLAQTAFGGGNSDAFIARIDTTATSSTAPGHNSAYFGGAGTDIGTSVALDTVGAVYMAGETSSATGFPLLNPLYGTLNGPSDAFVSKLSPFVNLGVTATALPTPVGVGNQVSYTYTITNGTTADPGDFVSGVTFTDVLPSSGNATFTSATASPGSCGAASGGTVVCNIGSLNSAGTAIVTVILVPTVGGALGNTGSVYLNGANLASANPSSVVNDFTLTAAPASVTVPAGLPATYTATLTPTGSIPDSVSLSCSAGLPTGATCTATTNPIPNLITGTQQTTMVINTTTRVTTITKLFHPGGPIYATLLPVVGLAFLGAGFGRKKNRKRLGLMLGMVFAFAMFLPGCGSTSSITTTTGTPAGTYAITVSATSGTAVRTTTVTLVVQ